MSHFVMMVRVSADVPAGALKERVAEMLAPYCEHDDKGRSARFMQFIDDEPEYRREYETGSSEMIRCPDGTLVTPWDDRFRVKGSIGLGGGSHHVPEGQGYERVTVPHRERYPDIEAFAKKWCGLERDDQGRLGHTANPNAKWDWWQIGGRWLGKLRVRPGAPTALAPLDRWADRDDHKRHAEARASNRADYARIADIDFAAALREAEERVENFWREVDLFMKGHDFPFFEGPREAMLSLGILTCRKKAELTGNEFWTRAWGPNTHGAYDFDVIAERPDREALREVVLSHFDPIRPWGWLDAEGWCANGDMGWWGASDATPESRLAAAREWKLRITSGDSRDWVVVVDCHI